mmetsp:Transcript_4069/g.7825  ORF Transcript_4069/g.7825 Transcript_4069/m.7825 type:complete len:81 (+) Transcript_4069:486-728(+)
MNGLESAIRLEDGTKDQLLKHTIREEDVHQSSQHPQERQPSFEELWNPDRFAFLLAFLAIYPLQSRNLNAKGTVKNCRNK